MGMNERIKLLAKLSGFKVDWQHEDVQALKMARFEKFAELIVWDCIEAIDAKEYTMGGDTEAKGMRFSINIIKKHFGVEE